MEINIWAILLCTVVSIVIGSIWYGPLFGKVFMKAMEMDRWTPEKRAAMTKRMGLTYALQFVSSIVMFYFLAAFVSDTGRMGVSGGIMVALCAWAGFVVPTKLGDALWGGKQILFWLGIGNMLITLVAAGAIIGAM